ncbi:MAG: LamG domain-containing protein [Candidatus Brocadia sp.]|nr:LamG domain-containing protein [Candidatus Brocadia sp.]
MVPARVSFSNFFVKEQFHLAQSERLYVDGQLVHTQTHPAGNTIVPYTAASYMAIGALSSNYGHMNGKVDEVRVYNRELSAGEVLSLFNI